MQAPLRFASRRLFVFWLIASAAICNVTLAAAEPGKPTGGKTVRLLTIGNSFAGNATHYLGDIAKADGNQLILRGSNMGGASMEQHWLKVQAFEKDPTDKAGLYTTGRSLQQDLQADRWDFVTIQQASFKSHDLATYRPFARQLFDYVKKYAPSAEVLLFETWAYRVDDPRFAVSNPAPGEPKSQKEMHEMLSKAYETIAAELGVRRIPVGDAFALANNDPNWGFKPTPNLKRDSYQYPTVPEQLHSLNKGYAWPKEKDKEGKWKLGMDGHHASTAGEYLGGCCFYEVIFGESCVGNKFVPPGLAPADARYLQETAHRAVAGK